MVMGHGHGVGLVVGHGFRTFITNLSNYIKGLKSHPLCPNSKVAPPVHQHNGKYRVARAAEMQCFVNVSST